MDSMFAGLAWEAERDHGVSVRALVAATFAASKVEAEIMSDEVYQQKIDLWHQNSLKMVLGMRVVLFLLSHLIKLLDLLW